MASTKYNTGKSVIAGEQPSGLTMPGIGSYSNSAWNGAGGGSSIWGSGAPIGSGLKTNDGSRTQTRNGEARGTELDSLANSREITGSSSLLDSSESEPWARRNSAQWAMPNSSVTNNLPKSRNGHGSTSPVRSRTNQHTRSNSPFLTNTLPAIGTSAQSKPQQQRSHLDPTSRTFNASGIFDNSLQMKGARTKYQGGQNGDDTLANLNSLHFGQLASNGASNFSGYASSAASRSGSLPPSRHGDDSVGPQFGDLSSTNPFHQSKSDIFSSHRTHQASHGNNMSLSGAGRMPSNTWDRSNDLSNGFGRMSLNRDGSDSFTSNWDQSYQMNSGVMNGTSGGSNFQRSGSVSYDPDNNGMPYMSQYQHFRLPYGEQSGQSPNGSDTRRGYDSPVFQHSTPPHHEHHRAPSNASSRSNFGGAGYNNSAVLLERKLKSLQQEQYAALQQNPNMANAAMAYNRQAPNFMQYGGHVTPQALARMNLNQPFFPQNMQAVNGFQGTSMGPPPPRAPPRGPALDSAAGDSLRSALMDEFRSSKGNRKYDLKDIYNHIVEFSGDQHGSRFIQQKLETANSDEKAQLFSEIFPNAWQLMTDVFGNYVVQKFFEHGNQTQKRQLADKMKGHIPELSVQMYGCRVVQKAFEHVLNDQQAVLVKELEPKVIECIKDQNGNHVVQKAIQWVPAENIEFINRAVSGQVAHLAAHSYGCRVIQRMLETFVGQQAQYDVIDELHASALNLIVDQYGNYVIQNVMDHGRPEDRLKLIEITISNVLMYSRHKYASNVVEHCLRNGNEEHRKRIVDVVRSTDENGQPRMQQLVRDQFGNYVIQTIMKILKADEIRAFIEEVKAAVEKVRLYSYGKHIATIDRCVLEKTEELDALARQQASLDTSAAATPPPLIEDDHSPQSASQPSTTNNSTVEGPVGSSGANSIKAGASSDINVVAEDAVVDAGRS